VSAPARSLRARRDPLAEPAVQRARLDAAMPAGPTFEGRLAAAGWPTLPRGPLGTLQLNLGKLCNMSCAHCHVDAGPDRLAENMSAATAARCVALITQLDVQTVDLTGGAPELSPHFRPLVAAARAAGRHVIDRCNLSVLLLASQADLADYLAENEVEVVASLPHPKAQSTDAQRGDGAFTRSVEGLRRLNAVGYGQGDPRRRLTLMHNPAGAFLPGGQVGLERLYRDTLRRTHGVTFDRLIALNNMPISRFLAWLEAQGQTEAYMDLLARSFNPAAVAGLMCRDTLSVGWDGQIYDCDFNQMLEMPIGGPAGRGSIFDLDLAALAATPVRTGAHCLGCTAGAGSSCGGATA